MHTLGIVLGILGLSAIMVLGTVLPNVLCISDPNERSARDFVPGNKKRLVIRIKRESKENN